MTWMQRCARGMAQHYNWQICSINENTSCFLLSGEISGQREGVEYNTLNRLRPLLPAAAGNDLTSIIHPKIDFEGFKSSGNLPFNHSLQSFADFGPGILMPIMTAGGKAVLG